MSVHSVLTAHPAPAPAPAPALDTMRWSVLSLTLLLLLRKIGKRGILGYSKTITPQLVVPQNPKSIYFTGAGVFFFWQVGAAKYLQQTCDLRNMEVVGASAGSLTGLLLLAGVDFDQATEVALTQTLESGVYSKGRGLAGELGSLLNAWLETVVPQDLSMESVENLKIAIAPAAFKSPKVVSDFADRRDVIDACLASCHIPVFLDGRATAMYRGEAVIDGSFYYFVTKDRFTGLPLPPGRSADDVLWVDYTDDDEFMASTGGNFLALQSPEGIKGMVESGYNHMKREHFYGRLPIARFQRPTYVVSSVLRDLGFSGVSLDDTSSSLAPAFSAPAQVFASAAPATTSAVASPPAVAPLPSLGTGSSRFWGIRVPSTLKSWATATTSLSTASAPGEVVEQVNSKNTTISSSKWLTSSSSFAEVSLKWFLAASGGASLAEVGSSFVNFLLMTLALAHGTSKLS